MPSQMRQLPFVSLRVDGKSSSDAVKKNEDFGGFNLCVLGLSPRPVSTNLCHGSVPRRFGHSVVCLGAQYSYTLTAQFLFDAFAITTVIKDATNLQSAYLMS